MGTETRLEIQPEDAPLLLRLDDGLMDVGRVARRERTEDDDDFSRAMWRQVPVGVRHSNQRLLVL